ncbi:hypothetical protein L1987_14631 [Smallanthus sonchifolius]|uniref:Uncharacterized protein n=1 Tax=Smallanthus sonchifolius TaxID=185202 RepID=A0ACB9J5K4_9ASTR|nr:hypothetical protein L1987_14631 [Smallanthus sonchifolius]
MEELGHQFESLLNMMDEQIKIIKDIASDMGEMIDIIELLPEHVAEIKNLIKSHFRMISDKVYMYEFDSMKMKFLIKHNMLEKIDIPSASSEGQDMDSTPYLERDIEKSFSFKPHSDKTTTFEQINPILPFQQDTELPMQQDPIERQRQKMIELYNLHQTDLRYIDFMGIYPRINYLQGSSACEIRYWYDFGAVNMIYLTSPDFPELIYLTKWILNSVKNCYQNNPTMTPKDTLALKLLSARLDFYKDYYYPAYHFIQLEKCQSFSYKVEITRKEFNSFNENDIHYKRAIGLRVVLQRMEATFKK